MKLKILLIGLASLLSFLVIIIFGNTAELKGKIGAFKAGEPCDDGNKCTVNDVFRPNGACTGVKKTLPAKRPKLCQQWSICNPATGEFNEVNKANGIICDDKNSSTSNDQCFNGTCKGTNIISSLCDTDGDGIITDKFKDFKFLAAVRKALGKEFNADIALQDALKTTFLNVSSSGLESLKNISGLECFVNLTNLDLSSNPKISDITPLTGLIKLTNLDLSFTGISNNLTPLKGLINLTTLYLGMSGISDVTSLAGLINLKDLILSGNNVSDITPLKNLTNLVYVDFWTNKISDISPLAGLTKLQELTVGGQTGLELVSDVTTLAGLTN